MAIRKQKWLHNLCWRIVNHNNAVFYRGLDKSKRCSEALDAMKGAHQGERCFIVGNGPSLSVQDLELIAGEDCFGANSIFRIFKKTSWRPTYYVTQDIYGDIKDEVNHLDVAHVLVGDYYWRKIGTSNSNAVCFHAVKPVDGNLYFGTDCHAGFCDYATVTFTMIQLAVFLGYTRIYLLGIDHSYARTVSSSGSVSCDGSTKNHFYEDSKAISIVGDVEGMEKAYRCSFAYAQGAGIQICNATRGGYLEVFPRVNLDSLFNEGVIRR